MQISFQVYRFRSFVSVQRRSRLGVTIVPASSLQIHALRARGSLDSTPGSTKLVTLSDAVKLAVDGNLQIPGSVILMLKKYSKVHVRYVQHMYMYLYTLYMHVHVCYCAFTIYHDT